MSAFKLLIVSVLENTKKKTEEMETIPTGFFRPNENLLNQEYGFSKEWGSG